MTLEISEDIPRKTRLSEEELRYSILNKIMAMKQVRKTFSLLFLLAFAAILAAQTADSIEVISGDLAQAQLDAYNARDLDAFLAPYSDSVRVYQFPCRLLYEGKKNMRDRYGAMFAMYPDLHCELVNRIVQGNTVIDQEKVTREKDMPLVEATAIYKIADGKIQEVYFMFRE